MQESTDRQPNKPKKPTSYNNYLKYSGLAFQILGAFLMLVLGGNWLDGYMELSFPAFTLTGSLLAIAFVFYSIFRLTKNMDSD